MTVAFLFFHRAETSDLKILISDISTVPVQALQALQGLATPRDLSLPEVAQHLLALSDVNEEWSSGATDVFTPDDTLVVLNKVDLISSSEHARGTIPEGNEELWRQCKEVGTAVCYMSCKTGEGVDNFMTSLGEMLKNM